MIQKLDPNTVILDPIQARQNYQTADKTAIKDRENMAAGCRIARKIGPVVILLLGTIVLAANSSGAAIGVGSISVIGGALWAMYHAYKWAIHKTEEHEGILAGSCDYCSNFREDLASIAQR